MLQNKHYANTAVTKTKPVCVMKNRRREKSFENSWRVNCLHLSFFSLFLFYFFFFLLLEEKKRKGTGRAGGWRWLLGDATGCCWASSLASRAPGAPSTHRGHRALCPPAAQVPCVLSRGSSPLQQICSLFGIYLFSKVHSGNETESLRLMHFVVRLHCICSALAGDIQLSFILMGVQAPGQ